jgi:hypothetical protein
MARPPNHYAVACPSHSLAVCTSRAAGCPVGPWRPAQRPLEHWMSPCLPACLPKRLVKYVGQVITETQYGILQIRLPLGLSILNT